MQYHAPGVYVEEVSGGARVIEAVGTSTAAFVGGTPNPGAHVNEAVRIQNWTEFVSNFVRPGDASTPLSNAVYGFQQNGGPTCYVVNTGGVDEPITGDGRGGRKGLEVLETLDEVAIVAAPGKTDAQSYEALTSFCEKMQTCVAILDAPKKFDGIEQLTKVATTPVPGPAAITEPPEPPGLRPRVSDHGFAAFYAPWIYAFDALSTKELVAVPPSGVVAGIYARTDFTRGVHKAPANEPVRTAVNLTYRFTREEQATLNVNGVNCIRFFPAQGIRLFGARTTAESSSEWKYVNVRRLFTMVENSIGQSTRWVVFEPNNFSLWKSLKRDVGAFLRLLWRDGALLGRTPEEAFFVKCDEETNPKEVIDAGMVVTVIGLAPVKPAEFVIFRIGQKPSGTEIEGGGANA